MTRSADRFSFPRAHRLDGPHAYATVFAFKCWVVGEWFQVYAKPSGAAAARLGIVVSKRTIPQAVERNFCKRLAREVFRREHAALAGSDLVVRPRAKVSQSIAHAARVELRELLHRARNQCIKRRAPV